ncbi:MAG: GAF domain-containing protein, partial [Solirubrobacteraceae bacterium]
MPPTAEKSQDRQPDARALRRALHELLQLEREVSELEYVRRSDALERAGDAIRVLGELASTAGILERAAAELGGASQFERVLISDLDGDDLRPLTLWTETGETLAPDRLTALRATPVRVVYPLIEAEATRHREVRRVSADGHQRAPAKLARWFGLHTYVVAPLTAHGEAIGLLHADTACSGRELDGLDAEVAARFAEGLSGVLERAVLRHTLALHRAELQAATQWMGGRLHRLAEGGIPDTRRPASEAGRRMAASLTPREREVLRLLAQG